MATLTIRNLPDQVHDALRLRAAEGRRSVEAEVRAILTEAVVGDALDDRTPHQGVAEAATEYAPRPSARDKARAIRSLQTMAAKVAAGKPAGWSIVDEFLAEKHLDAAWEDGRVSSEERLQWRARLERYEVQPAELETFVASRTPNP